MDDGIREAVEKYRVLKKRHARHLISYKNEGLLRVLNRLSLVAGHKVSHEVGALNGYPLTTGRQLIHGKTGLMKINATVGNATALEQRINDLAETRTVVFPTLT